MPFEQSWRQFCVSIRSVGALVGHTPKWQLWDLLAPGGFLELRRILSSCLKSLHCHDRFLHCTSWFHEVFIPLLYQSLVYPNSNIDHRPMRQRNCLFVIWLPQLQDYNMACIPRGQHWKPSKPRSCASHAQLKVRDQLGNGISFWVGA